MLDLGTEPQNPLLEEDGVEVAEILELVTGKPKEFWGKGYQPSEQYPFLRLLYWLTHSEVCRGWVLEYRGESPYKTQNQTIQPGEFVSLGTKLGWQKLTQYSIEGLKNVFVNTPDRKLDRRLNPVALPVSFWVGFVEVLRMLRDAGINVRHPDSGDLVWYEDIECNGRSFQAWELARQDYEREILPPVEEYWSEFIQGWNNPSPVITSWEESGEDEESQEKKIAAVIEQIRNLPPKGGDSLSAILGRLSEQERDRLIRELQKGDQMPQTPGRLGAALQEYMSRQEPPLRSIEGLVKVFLFRVYAGHPENYPLYEPMLELLKQIEQGEKPTPAHAAYAIVLPLLINVLRKDDGEKFENDEDLIRYYFPNNHHSNQRSGVS